MRMTRIEAAISKFGESLKVDPKNLTAYNNMGALLVIRSRHEEAVKILSKGLKLGPNDPQININLGRAYMALLKPDKAERHFKIAIKNKPKTNHEMVMREALSGLGDVYAGVGKTDAAIDQYLAALELNQTDPLAHFKVGEMYARKGKNKDAATYYFAALKINPRFGPARTALSMLEREVN